MALMATRRLGRLRSSVSVLRSLRLARLLELSGGPRVGMVLRLPRGGTAPWCSLRRRLRLVLRRPSGGPARRRSRLPVWLRSGRLRLVRPRWLELAWLRLLLLPRLAGWSALRVIVAIARAGRGGGGQAAEHERGAKAKRPGNAPGMKGHAHGTLLAAIVFHGPPRVPADPSAQSRDSRMKSWS